MSRHVPTKTPDLFYAHGSTRCGNLIGCSENFANKLQVRKTAPPEHSLRAFSSAILWRLCDWRLSMNSSVPLVPCWGCVVSFVAMRPLQACRAALCYLLKLFLCLQRGRRTHSHQQHGFKECFQVERRCVYVYVFLLDHSMLPWPDNEMDARGDKELHKWNYITAVLQFPLLRSPHCCRLSDPVSAALLPFERCEAPRHKWNPSWQKCHVQARES